MAHKWHGVLIAICPQGSLSSAMGAQQSPQSSLQVLGHACPQSLCNRMHGFGHLEVRCSGSSGWHILYMAALREWTVKSGLIYTKDNIFSDFRSQCLNDLCSIPYQAWYKGQCRNVQLMIHVLLSNQYPDLNKRVQIWSMRESRSYLLHTWPHSGRRTEHCLLHPPSLTCAKSASVRINVLSLGWFLQANSRSFPIHPSSSSMAKTCEV